MCDICMWMLKIEYGLIKIIYFLPIRACEKRYAFIGFVLICDSANSFDLLFVDYYWVFYNVLFFFWIGVASDNLSWQHTCPCSYHSFCYREGVVCSLVSLNCLIGKICDLKTVLKFSLKCISWNFSAVLATLQNFDWFSCLTSLHCSDHQNDDPLSHSDSDYNNSYYYYYYCYYYYYRFMTIILKMWVNLSCYFIAAMTLLYSDLDQWKVCSRTSWKQIWPGWVYAGPNQGDGKYKSCTCSYNLFGRHYMLIVDYNLLHWTTSIHDCSKSAKYSLRTLRKRMKSQQESSVLHVSTLYCKQ